MISALIAAAAVLTLVLATDERRFRPLLVLTCLTGGVANAVLAARRAGWQWSEAWPHLLVTTVGTGIVYAIAWATGH